MGIPQVRQSPAMQFTRCNLPSDLTDGISDDFEVNDNLSAFVIYEPNVVICDSKLSIG
jgi:hypothetical protein